MDGHIYSVQCISVLLILLIDIHHDMLQCIYFQVKLHHADNEHNHDQAIVAGHNF